MDQYGRFVELDLSPSGEALPVLRPLWAVGCGGPVVGTLDVFPQFTGQVVGLKNQLAERLGGAAFMAGGIAQKHQRLFRRVVNPGGEFGLPERMFHYLCSLETVHSVFWIIENSVNCLPSFLLFATD